MIQYTTHDYSLRDCDIVILKNNKSYIMFFDNNNFCKEHRIKIKFKLKEYMEKEGKI